MQHTHRVCHTLTVSATHSPCLRHTHRACHTLTVSATHSPCLQHTHRACNTLTVSATHSPCLQHTHHVYNTLTVSATHRVCHTLTVSATHSPCLPCCRQRVFFQAGIGLSPQRCLVKRSLCLLSSAEQIMIAACRRARHNARHYMVFNGLIHLTVCLTV